MDEERFNKGEDEENQSEEKAVDLNRVFGEEERDLNSMFPDGEMRKFLRQVDKNRRSNERFLKGIDRVRLWEDDE
jgi:hypothetical protein